MQLKDNIRGVLSVLAFVGAGVLLGFYVIHWLQTPPAKARQLGPLIAEIDAYKVAHGKDPTSCEEFASFAKLTNQFSIYCVYSEPAGKGSTLLADRVSGWKVIEHEFTVLLMPGGYKIFFPVAGSERQHAMSSDISAWQYDSGKGHWQKGRIYNTSFGPYWKPSSFP